MQLIQLEGHIQSLYLAVYPDKILLLDGGCRADVATVLNFIEQGLDRSRYDLKVVMVTHMHPDHAGGAHALRQATGCLIVSAQTEVPWYRGRLGHLIQKKDILLAHYVAWRQGKRPTYLAYPSVLQPDITVKDGEVIPQFEDWLVLETAGHTDRDLSFFHAETGQLYVADLIIRLTHKFVAPLPVHYPTQYKASLQKILQLNPHRYLLAHGGAMSIPADVVASLGVSAMTTSQSVMKSLSHQLRQKSKRKA